MNKAEELIACLEGEIAKRDEELAACRVAVENCEVFRARIAELEADRDSHQRCAIQAMAELAALKAQEPVGFAITDNDTGKLLPHAAFFMNRAKAEKLAALTGGCSVAPLYAAPVSEAKAQGVVIPPSPYMPGSQPTDFTDYELGEIHGRIAMWEEVKRLNAAPAAPAADAGLVLEQAMYALIGIGYHENSGLVHELRQSLAAHRAKGVV